MQVHRNLCEIAHQRRQRLLRDSPGDPTIQQRDVVISRRCTRGDERRDETTGFGRSRAIGRMLFEVCGDVKQKRRRRGKAGVRSETETASETPSILHATCRNGVEKGGTICGTGPGHRPTLQPRRSIRKRLAKFACWISTTLAVRVSHSVPGLERFCAAPRGRPVAFDFRVHSCSPLWLDPSHSPSRPGTVVLGRVRPAPAASAWHLRSFCGAVCFPRGRDRITVIGWAIQYTQKCISGLPLLVACIIRSSGFRA